MRALCVAVFSNEEMDNFRHAARGHVQLEDLFDLAHFKAGLFDGLFADADFRLIVIEQARAGFNQTSVRIAIDPCCHPELTDQHHALLFTVIEQNGCSVTTVIDLALVADHFTVVTCKIIGDVTQDKVVFRENFVFDNVNFQGHTGSTAQ